VVTEPVFVMDFGTCFSAAAVVSGAEVQLIREPSTGSFSWPSAVYLESGRLLAGSAAVHRRTRDPAGYRSELKRYLGQDAAIDLGGRGYPVRELVTAVIGALKNAAEAAAGTGISRAVLTVPASYGRADQRRRLLISAAEATGLRTVELLPEPVAAVFAPVMGQPPSPGDLVLVYDFGGGTFDTALVRIGDGQHEVLGSAALDDCGGLDLDAVLTSSLTASTGGWLQTAFTGEARPGGDSAALRIKLTIGDTARNLKHQLSDTTEAEEFILPDASPARLTRRELGALAAPLLDRTVECSRGLLKRLDVAPGDLSVVVTVGGSTRMPAVAELVGHAFGRPVRRADDPDLAVVQGAAQWARSYAVRKVPALPRSDGTTLLRWMIPPGRLLRWLVPLGATYEEGAPLARVRLDDGTIWDLCASRPGRVEHVLAETGDVVSKDRWLAVAHEQ
jgi:molecular chaperone DnaK (HSP70)